MSATVDQPAAERAGALSRLASPRLQALYSALVYLAIAVYITWPAPINLDSHIYGGIGDAFGALANLRELVEHNQLPILPGNLPDFAAPEGQSVAWIRSLASAPSQLLLWTLGWVFGPIAGYDLFVLIGFTASGLAAFLLGRKLTGSAGAGFVAGLGLAFMPLAQLKSHGHYEMAHTWVFVVLLWRMLELQQTPSRRNGLFAALAVLLALAWTPYFILFGGVLYATVAIATLLIAARRRELWEAVRAQLWPASFVLVYLVGFRLLAASSEAGQGLRVNSDQELITYSARLYEYLIPWGGNVLVGDETGPFLASHIHGSNGSESTLYVGLTVLALALVAIVQLLRRRLPEHLRTIAWILVAACIIAGLFSAPPQFQAFGVSIPMPSKFTSAISPTWRVYARFALVVQVALVLLAAIGVATLLRGRRPAIRAGLVGLIAVLVVVDLSPRQLGTNPITAPTIYEALKGKPRGILVEYPLVPAEQGAYDELLAQDFHDMPILNGYSSGSPEEARALAFADPSNPSTASGLAAIGVKYAVIRSIPGNANLPQPSSGFRLLEQDASGRLYAVDPKVTGPASSVVLQDGFDPPEQDPQGSYQWLTTPVGTMQVLAECGRCRGTVELTMDTFGPPRKVTITGAGRPIQATVGTRTLVRVPLRFSRSITLKITGDPGPIPVRQVIPGSTDPRSLVVNVRSARFVAR